MNRSVAVMLDVAAAAVGHQDAGQTQRGLRPSQVIPHRRKLILTVRNESERSR
jgi:hypothetical protein